MIPIIDTGHGYNTPGKRSEGFYDNEGRVLLKENSVNEAVGNKLSAFRWLDKTECYFITNEWYDVDLQERVNRERKLANKIMAQGEKSMFLSIHADAFHVKNKATGGRFFYHSESGKKLAQHFTKTLIDGGYELGLREPMKANFKVLRDTYSTAILFEMGFMTTKTDLDVLLKDSFRNKTALLLHQAILTI